MATKAKAARAVVAKVEAKVETEVEAKPDQDAPKVTRVSELIDAVVNASGVKKPQAKPVVEATLAALGLLLADGGALNLPGLGKMQLMRRKEKANGDVLVVKLRLPAEKKPKSPLAPAPEES